MGVSGDLGAHLLCMLRGLPLRSAVKHPRVLQRLPSYSHALLCYVSMCYVSCMQWPHAGCQRGSPHDLHELAVPAVLHLLCCALQDTVL